MDITGYNMVFMACEAVGYFSIVLIIEVLSAKQVNTTVLSVMHLTFSTLNCTTLLCMACEAIGYYTIVLSIKISSATYTGVLHRVPSTILRCTVLHTLHCTSLHVTILLNIEISLATGTVDTFYTPCTTLTTRAETAETKRNETKQNRTEQI